MGSSALTIDPGMQAAIAALLGKLDANALSALAPGLGALLESNYEPALKLAEVRRQRLAAQRLGDLEQARVLAQIERDLTQLVYPPQATGTPWIVGGAVLLVILILGAVAVALARRR